MVEADTLTDERLEAVGHSVAQVGLATQVRSVGVQHESVQLQFLGERQRHTVIDTVRGRLRDRERHIERDRETD